ncbi:MAG: hypothetical protein ACTS4U_01535 [Candidatus Hodgkinia cicadicola]
MLLMWIALDVNMLRKGWNGIMGNIVWTFSGGEMSLLPICGADLTKWRTFGGQMWIYETCFRLLEQG